MKLGRAGAAWQRLAAELGKFGVVGAINYGLDLGIFNLLLFTVLDGHPVPAKIVSTVIAATSSYFMNRHWTWRDRARSGTRRELTLFLIMSAVGLAITLGCLYLSHDVFGFKSKLADNISANLIGLVLATAWRFWSFKKWVFLHPDNGEPDPNPAQATALTTA